MAISESIAMSDITHLAEIPPTTAQASEGPEALVKPPSRNIVFLFSKLVVPDGHGWDTTLVLEDNQEPRFDICFTRNMDSQVHIIDARSNEILAKFTEYTFWSDTIEFFKYNGGMTVKVKDLFVLRHLPDDKEVIDVKIGEAVFGTWVTEEDSGESGIRWSLCDASDLNHRIAWMEEVRVQQPTGIISVPSAFVITPGYEPFWDLIIAGLAYRLDIARWREQLEKDLDVPRSQERLSVRT